MFLKEEAVTDGCWMIFSLSVTLVSLYPFDYYYYFLLLIWLAPEYFLCMTSGFNLGSFKDTASPNQLCMMPTWLLNTLLSSHFWYTVYDPCSGSWPRCYLSSYWPSMYDFSQDPDFDKATPVPSLVIISFTLCGCWHFASCWTWPTLPQYALCSYWNPCLPAWDLPTQTPSGAEISEFILLGALQSLFICYLGPIEEMYLHFVCQRHNRKGEELLS